MKPKLKVIYIIPSLHPGGAEYQAVNQLNRLAERGVDVRLVVLTDQLDLRSRLNLSKDRIHSLGIQGLTPLGLKSFPKFPMVLWRLHLLLKEYKPGLVIAILPISHFIVRMHRMWYGGKYRSWIYHRSMQYEANPLDTLFKRVFHYLNSLLSARYDYGHLFISQAVEQNICRYLPVKRGYVLHNALPERAVDASLAQADLRARSWSIGDYTIVIPGRLHPSKGHEFFLAVFRRFLDRNSEKRIKVFIVGGGHLKGKLEQLISVNQLDSSVFIAGFVGNDLLLSYLKMADLVCIPSINEGFGNVAIEALMQGATILASNTGGLPEIIEHEKNGFLFERESSEDLRDKLQVLYDNQVKLHPEVLVESYQKRFTLNAQVGKLLKILNV